MQSVSIKTYSVFATTIPAILLCIALIFIWDTQATKSAIAVAEQTISGSHDVITEHVERQMGMAPQVVALNQNLIENGSLNIQSLSEWRTTLVTQLVDSFPGLSAIVWADTDGRALWIGRYSDNAIYWALKNDGNQSMMQEWRLNADRSIPNAPTGEFEYNVLVRPWFRTVLDNKSPGWTPPFVWAGGEDVEQPTIGVSYGQPIHNSRGQITQVVDADYSLNDLSRYLSTISMRDPALTFIVDREDRILAISDANERLVNNNVIVNAASLTNPMVQAAIAIDGSVAILKDSLPLNRIQTDGLDFFMLSSKIGEDLDLDWHLVSFVPTSIFLHRTESALTYAVVISLFGLAFALLVGRIFASRLSRPVQKLAHVANRIGSGHYSETSPDSRFTELNDLGEAVNSLGKVLNNRDSLLQNLESMSRKERLLRRELDHRVKNTLFQISSLCSEAKSRTQGDVSAIEDLGARIHAFSAVHEIQNGTNQGEIELRDLCQVVMQPYIKEEHDSIDMSGPDLGISSDAAMTLAMVINELAMNSRKYGALKNSKGSIDLHWDLAPQGSSWNRCQIQWSEQTTEPSQKNSVSGFGTLFLENAIPHELGGTVEYHIESQSVSFTTTIERQQLERLPDGKDPAKSTPT